MIRGKSFVSIRYQLPKGRLAGLALIFFYMIHRVGRSRISCCGAAKRVSCSWAVEEGGRLWGGELGEARRVMKRRKGSGVGDGRVIIRDKGDNKRNFKGWAKLIFTCYKFPYILILSTERFPLQYESDTSPWLPITRIPLVSRDTFSHLYSHVVLRTLSRILSRSV